MCIPRLLLLLLLISVSVAPVVAQSSPDDSSSDKSVFSSQPQLDGLTAPLEFRSSFSAFSGRALDGISGSLSSLRNYSEHFDQFKTLPQLKLGKSDTTCFSMRIYRVTPDDPQSETTRFSGYSTCQIAGRYQTKDAVGILEIVPR